MSCGVEVETLGVGLGVFGTPVNSWDFVSWVSVIVDNIRRAEVPVLVKMLLCLCKGPFRAAGSEEQHLEEELVSDGSQVLSIWVSLVVPFEMFELYRWRLAWGLR